MNKSSTFNRLKFGARTRTFFLKWIPSVASLSPVLPGRLLLLRVLLLLPFLFLASWLSISIVFLDRMVQNIDRMVQNISEPKDFSPPMIHAIEKLTLVVPAA